MQRMIIILHTDFVVEILVVTYKSKFPTCAALCCSNVSQFHGTAQYNNNKGDKNITNNNTQQATTNW